MSRAFIVTIFVFALGMFFLLKEPSPTVNSPSQNRPVQRENSDDKTLPHEDSLKTEAETPSSPDATPQGPPKTLSPAQAPTESAVHYALRDGYVVLDEDIVLGLPNPNMEEAGLAKPPRNGDWTSPVIPFHIQPGVEQPERILAALQLFEDSPVRFVEYTNQTDVLVFEKGDSNCRSYLGRIGGQQPIWISPRCSPSDIAHEILHALGFVHEQNRTDRDKYVEVLWENIPEEFQINFQILPSALMKVSALAAFDYESLMIYPPNTFAKRPNEPTLRSKTNQEISPRQTLSPKDLQRLRALFR